MNRTRDYYRKMRAKHIHRKKETDFMKNEEQIRADEREKVVMEILKAIELEYDLNYGETLMNPRNIYDLVENYRKL